jgi:hypothetical protein
MVTLGERNSRMKDFFDIWFLAANFEFGEAGFADSVAHTFRRRGTPLPLERPLPLTAALTKSAVKQQQWRAFLSRANLTKSAPSLDDVSDLIWALGEPAMLAGRTRESLRRVWKPGKGWIP